MRVLFRFGDFIVDGEVLDISFEDDHLTINARTIKTGAVIEEDDENVFIECCGFVKVFGVCEHE